LNEFYLGYDKDGTATPVCHYISWNISVSSVC